MPPTTAALPQELIDTVIDNIASVPPTSSERRDLANCGLASRSLLPRASTLLLKRIEVVASSLPQFLVAVGKLERVTTYCRELVVNGRTDITLYLDQIFQNVPHLRYLELWSNRLPREGFAVATDPQSTTKPSSFTNDTTVQPVNVSVGPSLYRPARTGSHYLSTLKLSCVELKALQNFLRPFHRIDTLELRSVEDADKNMDRWGATYYDSAKGAYLRQGVGPATLPSVGRLVLDNCCDHDVTAVLALIGLRPSAVTFYGLLFPDLATLQGFLRDVGEEVQELDLSRTKGLWNGDPSLLRRTLSPEADTSVSISCPKLDTLSLSFSDTGRHIICMDSFRSLFSSLRRLRITGRPHQLEDILTFFADKLLHNSRFFANLESLEFVCLDTQSNPTNHSLTLASLQGKVDSALPVRYSTITKIVR